MRIAVLNPNSSTEVTALMAKAIADMPETEGLRTVCETLPDGPIGIETDDHVAEVAPRVAEYAARMRADALVIACFSDPGAEAARSRTAKPVTGIAEAAYREAARRGSRFGVVSLGPASVARHRVRIAQLGLLEALAGDRPVGMSVAEGHAPDALARIEPVARALVEVDGAASVILGCAGLAALRRPLEDRLGVPVIDPVQAGVTSAAAMLAEGTRS